MHEQEQTQEQTQEQNQEQGQEQQKPDEEEKQQQQQQQAPSAHIPFQAWKSGREGQVERQYIQVGGIGLW